MKQLILLFIGMTFIWSCKHEPPVLSPSVDALNTGNNGNNGSGNNGGGNNGGNVIICDTNVVYFKQDILPILISNCTNNPNNASGAGCHDVNSHAENVILTSFNYVINTAGVVPYNTNNGKFIRAITTQNSDDKMPPPPMASLTAAQIGLIKKWILQGAKDTSCTNSGCDSINVSFSNKVMPIITNKCKGCHSGSTPGGNILLIDYGTVSASATSGKLMGSITFAPTYKPMPKNAAKLSSCEIAIISNWIAEGKNNN